MLNTSIRVAGIEMSANENKYVFVGAVRTIQIIKFGKKSRNYSPLLFHRLLRLRFILIRSILIWRTDMLPFVYTVQKSPSPSIRVTVLHTTNCALRFPPQL